jgi:hypothetical protein
MTTTILRFGSSNRISRVASRVLCAMIAMFAPAAFCAVPPAGTPLPAKAAIQADYGKIPLSFEANQGQTDRRVQFFSRGSGYGLFLTPGEAVLALERSKGLQTSTLRMKLMGANVAAPVAGQQLLPGTVNYFMGRDAGKWSTGVKTYGRVNYTGVYPGIDLVYYGNQRQLEYDFVVAPGADPKKIALSFSGATPKLDKDGNLVLTDRETTTSFHKPVVYQMAGDKRVEVAGAYELAGKQVRFALGSYDHSKPLVIDPVLTYATFLGGNQQDEGVAITADAAGNAYVVGDTISPNFPLMNPFQSTNHDTSNGFVVFVSKLNPAGTALVYSTFLGGVSDSHALGVAVDASGSAYVAGYTGAGDYPVTAGAFQVFCGANFTTATGPEVRINGCSPSGDTGGFVTKLSPTGDSLVYSTFLSGSGFTQVTAIAVNVDGEAYVTGNSTSGCGAGPYYPAPFGENSIDCFPTTPGALQTELNGAFTPDSSIYAFFSKFSADGSRLLYSTMFAAPLSANGLRDLATAIAVDAAGNAYITGNAGFGLPTTSNAFYVPPNSNSFPPLAAFVAKFNPTLSGPASLVYNTYLGSAAQTANATNYNNTATGIAVDPNGDAVVAGYTDVCGYPTTMGVYQTVTGSGPFCQDGFVTKVNQDGTGLVWSTLLGSTNPNNTSNSTLTSLALGANGNVYVTGTVQGSSFPQVNPIHAAVNGGAVLAELDPSGSNVLFATYFSGFGSSDYGSGVATDVNGNMYVTGKVSSNTPTIPVTPNAIQQTFGGGGYDAYVVKVAPLATSTTTLALSSGSVSSGQLVTLTATVAGPAGSSTPTGTVTFLNGSSTLGTGTLDDTGMVTFSGSTLAATTYTLTARYGGDTTYSGSTSGAQTLVVTPIETSTALTVTPPNVVFGTSVSLVAKVTPASGTAIPTGSVTFKNGTTQIANVPMGSAGTATFTSPTFAVGSYSFTAAYSGDSNDAPSISTAASLTVTPPVSTGGGGTIVLITTTSLTKLSNGSYQGTVTVRNQGTGTAPNLVLTSAKVGAATGTPTPQSLGSIPAGGSVVTSVSFPATAGNSGAPELEQIAGTYTGGTFGGSLRVTLP